jgi:hypothetical protein|tara:strand:+ start:1527 stop:1700 length:174 start_codon:yes stop_codon:yes gene_type:complete
MVDWKKNMLIFMRVIGHKTNDWHPELWVNYGISEEDARVIVTEYEQAFPDDADHGKV